MAQHLHCAGLKTFASLQSTRQLSEHTSAGLGLTWQPKVGVGLQLSSTRQLSDTTSADFNWVVGPRAAQGAGLSISRRGEKLITSARLDVRARLLPDHVDLVLTSRFLMARMPASTHQLARADVEQAIMATM